MSEKVLLAVPGPSVLARVSQAIHRTKDEAEGYDLQVVHFDGQEGFVNFNQAWRRALNEAARPDGIAYFAMLHADVEPCAGWLNRAVGAMRSNPDLGMVSLPVAIKEDRGHLSCGVGTDDWWPYRRLMVRELVKVKDSLLSADALCAHWKMRLPKGRHLMHNSGCWVADPRKPEWRREIDTGLGYRSLPCFLLPMRLSETCGMVDFTAASDDYNFSRMAHRAGIRSALMTDSPTIHWQAGRAYPSHTVKAGMQERDMDGGWVMDDRSTAS